MKKKKRTFEKKEKSISFTKKLFIIKYKILINREGEKKKAQDLDKSMKNKLLKMEREKKNLREIKFKLKLIEAEEI